MKKLLLLFSALLVTTITLQAQQRSYMVYLKNGAISIPAKLTIAEEESGRALFNGHYYVLLQFNTIPDVQKRTALQKAGVILGDYLPHFCFVARLPEGYSQETLKAAGVRGLCTIQPTWKVDDRLAAYWNVINAGQIRAQMIFHQQLSLPEVIQNITATGGLVIETNDMLHQLTVEFDASLLSVFAAKPWLNWVEPVAPEPSAMNLPGKTLIRANVLNAAPAFGRNLQGQGVIMGIWDGGSVGTHIDFTGRQTNMQASSVSTHATHVTGTIGGAGIKDRTNQGMAPKSTLLNWDFGGNVSSEITTAISSNKINLTNNSWGYSPNIDSCSFRGRYDAQSRAMDVIANNSPNVTQVWAAGNYQSDNCATGGFRTVLSGYQSAKNVIVIGAVDRNDAMSNFSSFGPVRDNRIKPDICAVGVAVNSTFPNQAYQSNQGTSMATPAASGAMALLYERFRQLNSNADPDAMLMRNIVANTAEDLGNIGPDFRHGFGRMNAVRAVKLIEENRYFSSVLMPASTNSHNISIPAGCRRVKVMITWNDPAANAMASMALINDLDIVLENKSAQQTLPWRLSALSLNTTAQRGRDSINNIEQITLDNPDTAGYTLKVNGLVATTNGQRYYITYEYEFASLEVAYPNGGEAFVPAASEQIRWDSKFVGTNVQLHYSADGGQSWTLITTNQPGTARQFTWTVPSIVSSKVLLRVRTLDSSITDISDTTFSILATPGSLQTRLCSAQVHLTWGTTTGAIGYEAAILKNGEWEVQAITPAAVRAYTFTGLTNNQEYWLTVRAIGPDSARGNFANALNVTPTATNIAPSFTKNLFEVTSACLNKPVTLRLQSAGSPTLTRQWSRSTNGGSTWSTVSGTTDSLVLGSVTGAMENYQYRMNLTSSVCGNTITSVITTLKIDTGLILTRDPSDATACHGATISFTYGAIAKTLPSTLWQTSKDSGATWRNLLTIQDTSISFAASDTLNRYMIRAIASNGCVTGDTTGAATISVKPKLAISTTNDTSLCIGKSISIQVQVTGGASVPVINWTNLGSNPSYTVTPSASTTYRVTVSDSCSLPITDSVKVTVIVVDSTFTHDGTSGKNQVSFVASEAFANSYNWNFGDGSATSNFRSTGHFFSANGNYNVCLTVTKNGCSYTTCQTINVTRTDAEVLNDLSNNILIYPNPASSALNISSPVAAKHIALTNELGAEVWSTSPESQNILVPLTGIPSGVYFISINTEAGTARKKVVIIK